MITHRADLRPIRTRRIWPYPVVGALLLPALCLATNVQVVATTPGRSADLVIERGAPVTIEVGETVDGVTLLRVDRNGAVLSIDGITKTVPLGVDAASSGDAGSATVTLAADARGQFLTSGTVNGRPVRFIVDTGAALTTLFRADAKRIGLNYRGGTPTKAATVNGIVQGWRVTLDSVRVGNMTLRSVDAMVVDNDTLPVGLLGMSFLGRCEMHRQGSTLVLRRRH